MRARPPSEALRSARTCPRVRFARIGLLAVACALLSPAPTALADCTPDSATAVTGDSVTCTDTTPGGFVAGAGVEDLRITIEQDAVIQNAAPGDAAVEINANNPGDPGDPGNGIPPAYGVLNLGTIEISGDGSVGIRGADSAPGELNFLRNAFSIRATSDQSNGSIGIELGDFGVVENAGGIELRGAGSIGIRVGQDGVVTDTVGIRNIESDAGADVIGIDAGDRSIVTLDASARTDVYGDRNIGIRAGDDAFVSVRGVLFAVGADGENDPNDIDDPIGVVLGSNTSDLGTIDQPRGLSISGLVFATGRNARGAVVGSGWIGPSNDIRIEAGARLRGRGDDAIGLLVGDDNAVTIAGTVEAEGPRGVAVFMGDQNRVPTDPADPDAKLVVIGSVVATGVDAVGVSLGAKAADGPDENIANSTRPSMELGSFARRIRSVMTGEAESGPLVLFRDATSDLNHLVITEGSEILADETLFFEPNRAIAIQGTDGGERVDNYGTLAGKVLLEGGDDYFELGPTGRFSGDMSVNGGPGTDTLELGNRWNLSPLFTPPEASFEFDDYRGFERLIVDDVTPRRATGFSNGNAFELVDISAGSQLTVANPLAFRPQADTFANRGAFAGGAELGAGADTFILGAGARLSGKSLVDGGAGLDAVVLEGDGSGLTDDLAGASLAGFESIQLQATSRWRIGGDLRAANPGVALQAESDAWLVVREALSIDGTIDLDPDAGLRIELQRTNAAAYVQASGIVTIDPTSSLEVDLAGTLDPGPLVLISAASLNGTFDPLEIVLPDDDPIYTFSNLVQDPIAGTVTLFVDRDPFAFNREITDGYVSNIYASDPSDELNTFVEALNALDTDEYLETLDLLHPETYDVQTSVQLAMARQFQQTLLDRPGHCIAPARSGRRDPRTKVPCRPRPLDVWAVGYGLFRNRDGADGHVSWSDDGGGLVLGVDHRQGESWLLSANVGGAHAISEVDRVGKGRFTALDAGALAAWTRGPALVQGFVTYGHGWHQAYRNVAFSGVRREAEGEWESNRVSIGGEVRWTFALDGLDLTPTFDADWALVSRPGFTEQGAAPLDLRVEGATDTVTTLRLGIELGTSVLRKGYFTDFFEAADGVWQPELSVKWRQVVSGDDRALTSAIVGAPASTGDTTVFSDDAGEGFEIGAGVWFTPKDATRITVGVRYDAFVWKDIVSHDLKGTVGYSF